MKIFDCFMYFDEDVVLDLRLNYLDKYIDKFIIVESKFNHKGEKREPLFKINNFNKFEKKIVYILLDQQPSGIEQINSSDNNSEQTRKYILNSIKRENSQRNGILKGLNDASDNDWILISDLDEIPILENINFNEINNKFLFFQQDMFYYKFNLKLNNIKWVGTKACKKINLKNPQWLRNIKDKVYPWWRLDILFSENKYSDIKKINKGGWHFSYIKKAHSIEKKLKSYLHHREYDLNPIGEKTIQDLINNKKAIYNLKLDMRSWNKIGTGGDLSVIELDELPEYISLNKNIFIDWIEK